jgi:hypothetical protein
MVIFLKKNKKFEVENCWLTQRSRWVDGCNSSVMDYLQKSQRQALKQWTTIKEDYILMPGPVLKLVLAVATRRAIVKSGGKFLVRD